MVKNVQLNDIVEMKKEHPCKERNRYFQVVRVGADIRIKCLGCGNYLLFTREDFLSKCKRIVPPEEYKNS